MKHNRHTVFSVLSLGIALLATVSIITTLRGYFFTNASAPGEVARGFISSAVWESQAVTVAEVSKEATVIVRARVVEEPVSRLVRTELPVLDEKDNIVGAQVFETLFADTTFEVVEVLSGSAPSTVTVLQTGGFFEDSPEQKVEMHDDPLYTTGEEHILFLVNISGDKVHAPDRELYRIVNPAGRYRIEGATVVSYVESAEQRSVPTTLSDLLAQIKQAVGT